MRATSSMADGGRRWVPRALDRGAHGDCDLVEVLAGIVEHRGACEEPGATSKRRSRAHGGYRPWPAVTWASQAHNVPTLVPPPPPPNVRGARPRRTLNPNPRGPVVRVK